MSPVGRDTLIKNFEDDGVSQAQSKQFADCAESG